MKHIIKRGFILLSINLVLTIPALSQITLDSTQTKTLCLILNEHEKLSIENPLLKKQINSLQELNELYIKSDSIQKKEISLYQEKVFLDEKQIKQLKKNQKNLIIGSSIGGVLLFFIGLIL